MSGSLVTAVNCGGKKFHTTVKQTSRKIEQTELQTPPILLLTVEYPQSDRLSSIFPKPIDGTSPTINNVGRTDSIPIIQLGDSVIKDGVYEENIEGESSRKNDPEYSPAVVIRNNNEASGSNTGKTFSKGSLFSEQAVLNNFLFTPLPKSVVCTVMPKETREKIDAIVEVEYQQSDRLSSIFPKPIEGTSPTINNVSRTDSIPIIQLGDSVIKDGVYEGNIEGESNRKNDTEYSPVVVIRNNNEASGSNTSKTFSKGSSFSEQAVLNNFLFTPLPKSVVCTVMPKEAREKIDGIVENPPGCDNISPEIGDNINDMEKFGDWDDYSSGEDTAVHVIADKPTICRAVASLPVNFLYFGKSSSKSKTCKGVFAKRDIPRRAQFGPMEGVLCPIDSDVKEHHHLELILVNNEVQHRLDVSNENTSNWMRYVRHAESINEQNLNLQQTGKNLYFTATRMIPPGEELKAWYSVSYAKARNLVCYPGKIKPIRNTISSNNQTTEKNQGSVLTHKEEALESSKWKCSHCQRIFKTATLFNLHVLTHAADNVEINSEKAPASSLEEANEDNGSIKKTLTCSECPKTFSSNATLAAHSRSHATVKMFDCPICKEIFYKVRHLKEHIHGHAVGGNFFCPHCSKKFKEYKHIRNHIRRFHCGKNFYCVHCLKSFSTLDKLKMHLLSHSDLRAFSCTNCGKQFKRKDKLSVHIKKKHCPCLEKQTTVSVTANGTKKILHQDVVNLRNYSKFVYKCHICVLGFKRRGMLVNHLANRHPGITPESVPELNLPILKANKDYYCQYCDKIYKSSSKRKAHILKNHPGEKLPLSNRQVSSKDGSDKNGTYSQTVGSVTTNPQRCEWCHKQYASKTKLLQHQRDKHPNQLPKTLLHPKRPNGSNSETKERDPTKEVVDKVADSDIFLSESLELSEYELSVGDSKFFSDGEFIIDANTLKRALKGEVLAADCSPETLVELGHTDGYFKVYQGPSGITLARPVEIWDPLSLCLSPPSDVLPLTHLLHPMQ